MSEPLSALCQQGVMRFAKPVLVPMGTKIDIPVVAMAAEPRRITWSVVGFYVNDKMYKEILADDEMRGMFQVVEAPK